MSVDVIGLGKPVMDYVVNLPYMPPKDGEVYARDMFNQGGGKVSTGMVACARLGLKAGVVAKVGEDFTGDFILRDFSFNGVDTSRIIRGEQNTSSPLCITLSEEETGTRIIIGREHTVTSLTPDEVDYEYIKSAKYLLLENGEEASLSAARYAKKHNVTVMVDGDQFTEELEQMLPWVDIFIGSEYYQKERFGSLSISESCEAVHLMGPSVVWFTLGGKGSAGLIDGTFHEQPAFPVKVRDTTGAGDVFHGAYIVALMKGMPHIECARYASAAAAIKCTYVGGRTGIPTQDIIERFLRDGVIETEELDERLEYYLTSFGK